MIGIIKKFFTLLFILLLGCLLFWLINKKQPNFRPENPKDQSWFSEQRWLTDAEIDWAVEQIPLSDKFKTLPAYQFHYVKEAKREEAEADLAFPELLNTINDQSKELIFIPVNNPDFHWSLLVYEVKTKIFYHYDTLRGANWEYAQPLCEELLKFLLVDWQDASYHLQTQHDIKQGNSYDCGVAVISLIERISGKYQENMENIDLGEFDFGKDRKDLRKTYFKKY
ncbi:MAG: hypothetical protein LBR43_00535 [Spiroplasmataceae bacterium]|nr:hypothetical protein [Spiroplasmataceae bacterium]